MKRNNISNATMRMCIIATIVILFSLLAAQPAAAQWGSQTAAFAQTPTTSFQSTSTMAGSGSQYASQPMMDNGSATYSAAAPSQAVARKAGITNPDGNDEDDETIVPLGDAVLPLTLMLLAFALWRFRRQRLA